MRRRMQRERLSRKHRGARESAPSFIPHKHRPLQEAASGNAERMVFVLCRRVGSVSGGLGHLCAHRKWEGRSHYLPKAISHTQEAIHGPRRLKLALLSGCHTASCARSPVEERLLQGHLGGAFPSLRTPQPALLTHKFDVSAVFGVPTLTVRRQKPVGIKTGQFSLRFNHLSSSFRVSAHQSSRMQTAWLINIRFIPPHLHEHTACLIEITEASEPPPPPPR